MRTCALSLTLDCAERAAICASARVLRKLDRGIASLMAIANIAPLLGTLVTAVALIDELVRPLCGDCAGGLAETLVLLALSLPVAILACAAFHYLNRQVEILDLQMRTATLDLLTSLAHIPRTT